MMFSSPLIIILVERKNFRQIPDQCPISFPPNKTNFWGSNKVGKNINEIKMIPVKKNKENKIFLIMPLKKLNQILETLSFGNNLNFRIIYK